MRRLSIALALTLLALRTAGAQDLLLKNGMIVDPAARTVAPGSIVIRGERIVDVLREAPAAFPGRVIDLGGKWVMPGLNDMHVHSFGNVGPGGRAEYLGTDGAARIMLYAGITGFLDLFSPEDMILSLRDRQRKDGFLGADIYCAGPIFTSTGGHGTEYGIPTRVIDSPAEAERQVGELAARRPDVVKIVYDHAATWMPTIDRATMEAAVRAAKKHGIPTVIHIGTWTDAREAIEAGASCITHIYLDAPLPDSLVTLMRDRGVYEIPTMTVESDFANMLRDPTLRSRPLLASVASADLIAAYADSNALDERMRGFYRWQARGEAALAASVRRLSQGGVRLLAGTDAGNPGTFQGYSLHRELELMVEAGISPWDALASATTVAGEFLGREFGIRPGGLANLLVVEGSPVESIANTQRIAMVIYRGAPVDREGMLHPAARPWTAPLVDDFSSGSARSPAGPLWSIDLDSSFGGSSTMTAEYRNGTIHLRGRLSPKPGMPGLAGISLQLDSGGAPFDLTRFDGVKLRIGGTGGPVLLKLITDGVKNYDYHAAAIPSGAKVREVTIPFARLGQLWSPPVRWSGNDVRGIALWVSGVAPADFDFTVDSIELYSAKK